MNSQNFAPRAQEIIDRLERIPKNRYHCEPDVVRECFNEHFRLLKLDPLPIRWVKDLCEGYDVVTALAESAARSAAWNAARSAAWNAAESAAESAAYFNLPNPSAAQKKFAEICHPMVRAREAGLWIYWVTEKEIVCCSPPDLQVMDGRLHCETTPAVTWPDSKTCFWFLKGVQVTEPIVKRQFRWEDIDNQSNSEVRRIMMDLYGSERYIKDAKIKPVHQDDFGTLYTKNNSDGSSFAVVKVVNSTAELDGSFKDYWLRVNPTCYGGKAGKIAWAAVASTWRDKTGNLAFANYQDYCPAFET